MAVKYLKAFFLLPVIVLDPSPLAPLKIWEITKSNPKYNQLDSSQIMEKTYYTLPKDAYAYMNLVDKDLQREGFPFVIAVSNRISRTGVFSSFWYKLDDDDEEWFIAWSLKVLAHEFAHTFHMPHCTRYECLMNKGDKSWKPYYLCCFCLRKL